MWVIEWPCLCLYSPVTERDSTSMSVYYTVQRLACQLCLSPPLCVKKACHGPSLSHTFTHTHPSRLPSDLWFSWCVLQSPCSAGISSHKAPKATAFLLNHRRANPQIYLSSYDAPVLPVKAVNSPKNENSVIINSPLCCSKPVWL